MTPHEQLLRDFFALPSGDRAAIVKQLGHNERQLLEKLQRAKQQAPATAPQDPCSDFSAHTPAFAKLLLRLIAEAEAGKSQLTPAAQNALHACLSRSAAAEATR